ncbi:MAG: tRNA 2-thiouridine(34) synthase MnmA [Clostridia bacterium]|nr:tRNA 2-thiouridine(34) synthase MnmA [Clostridia bacterium]
MSKKVVLGLSGGVDSSAAALILKNEGYEVIGVTLVMFDGAEDSIRSAADTAKALDIEHAVINIRKEFKKKIINNFTSSYISCKTPSPCVICNREIKFASLYRAAHDFSAEYVATGHYAHTEKLGDRTILKRAESRKDQSYFLSRLTSKQLEHALFPLGGLEKDEIRKIAKNVSLPCAEKKDSQEICFVPDNDYVKFITEKTDHKPVEGDFIDTDGNILGRHRGIINYTVGQRKGLGAFGKPMFVKALVPETNSVILGENGEQYSSSLFADNLNWQAFDSPPEKFNALVKIRSRADLAPADIRLEKNRVKVTFDEPQRSVTPGQFAVFYDRDIVLGSGVII